jgi:hypothetical protein
MWSQQQHWNVAGVVCCYQKQLLLCAGMLQVLFVVIRNSCYVLECSRYCFLLSETVDVMYWNVGNSTTKRTKIGEYYTADTILVMLCTNCTSWENVLQFRHSGCIACPSTYRQCFIIWSKSPPERRFELRISGEFNTKAVRSQRFRPTLRTVPFCDYSQVQAKYSLNIALHFVTTARYTHRTR